MNWKSPCADEVVAPAAGVKSDSIFAVVSRYSKLVPLVLAACLIAPAMRTREGSTPGVAVALNVSADMFWSPLPAKRPIRPSRKLPFAPKARSQWGGLVKEGKKRGHTHAIGEPMPRCECATGDRPVKRSFAV